MKLHSSDTSPYARKVRVVILEHGLEDQVMVVQSNPMAKDAAAFTGNPLSKVPTLVLDDGTALFDSPVICEYLGALGARQRLIPENGAGRWPVLRAQALGDGILDAAFSLVMESRRPEAERSAHWQDRWTGAIQSGVEAVAQDIAAGVGAFDLGRITYAVALGYLDFRLPQIDWRAANCGLSGWYADIQSRDSLVRTRPPA